MSIMYRSCIYNITLLYEFIYYEYVLKNCCAYSNFQIIYFILFECSWSIVFVGYVSYE